MTKVKNRKVISAFLAICMLFTMVMSFSTSASAAEVSSDTPAVTQESNESIVPYARGDVIAEKSGVLKAGQEVTLDFKINNIFGKDVAITVGARGVNGGSGNVRYYFKAYNAPVQFGETKVMETINLPYGNHSVTLRNPTSDCIYSIVVFED